MSIHITVLKFELKQTRDTQKTIPLGINTIDFEVCEDNPVRINMVDTYVPSITNDLYYEMNNQLVQY